MMSQTTAPAVNMEQGDDGLIAQAFDDAVVESKVSAAAIPFGYLVAQGTAQDEVKLPAAATDVTADAIGIAVQRDSLPSDSSSDKSYPIADSIPVLRRGKAWVRVEAAVAIGGDVFVNWQNGNEGQFRDDNDGGNAAQLPGAKFRSAAGDGELAIVELNLPQ